MERIYIHAKTEEMCAVIADAIEPVDTELVCGWTDEDVEERDLSEYDVIIISTPLRKEFGLDLVARVSKQTSASIIVLTRADIVDAVQERIKFTGAFTLGRPFSKGTLMQTIRMAMLTREKVERLEQENTRLSRKLSDIKLIDRAKCCLIQYLNLTEEQAHRHIQKLAMDTHATQREIAEDILKTYSM